MRLYKQLSVSYIRYSISNSNLKIFFQISKFQISKFIFFWILVYPSIISLFKHLGRYVCIKRYHRALLAAVTVSMFLCRASSSCCVRNSPDEIPLALASSLLSMRLWISGREMSDLIAAFRQLIACSTIFRKKECLPCLLFNLFLSPVGILRALKVIWRPMLSRGGLSILLPEIREIAFLS